MVIFCFETINSKGEKDILYLSKMIQTEPFQVSSAYWSNHSIV